MTIRRGLYLVAVWKLRCAWAGGEAVWVQPSGKYPSVWGTAVFVT